MTLSDLAKKYAYAPQTGALIKALSDSSIHTIYCEGLRGSAAALYLRALTLRHAGIYVFILNDMEEAGYFYHDLTQIRGNEEVLFFPDSYRRDIIYGQKDPSKEVSRSNTLSRLQQGSDNLCVVTYPDALAERVMTHAELEKRTLPLHVNEQTDIRFVTDLLSEFGFERVDYVYEPGQFAVRGSIVDVFTYACEYPYRIDFFGNEIESIRTFNIQNQLSIERKNSVSIIPEPGKGSSMTIQFLDFIPQESVLCTQNPLWVAERVEAIYERISQRENVDNQEARMDVSPKNLINGETLSSRMKDFKHLVFGPQRSGMPDARIGFHTTVQPSFHKNFDLVTGTFQDLTLRGFTIHICSDSAKQTDRIKAILEERDKSLGFIPVERTLHQGFTDADMKLCLFTDHQLFDRFHKYSLRSDKVGMGKMAQSLKELNQFSPGDYVVHTDHGIGRFAGLVHIPNGATTQEVMKLVYRNDDVVFVSIHSLHKVSKYKGKEGEAPQLNKLGTGAWEKLKNRTKSKIKDIARDLIKLYSQRRKEKGYAFSPDSFLQQELEASFLYEDTPDQSKACAEVKADMESTRPMDRLICGDVGFGKTEIAIRAAFKAAADNKQVAVLVPTTVLAYQHYQTFSERLKEMPCKVEYLSRARSGKQAKEILESLKRGDIDILIGTHRILAKDVSFKDLGLLIVDEEQKFGVAVKEKLRQLKVNIDTLTMTATPIPRTLQFSLMGARDLSIISTPPPNRYPIHTEVHTFNEDIIIEAVNFEMSRNGQVFFVNNRVANLPELEEMIKRRVPDCKTATAHGQMNPQELEKIILGFINYDYDVLISTTIIENGIDIPNANTIIINQAQNFGLSDLHQMRGRVGRSNKKAFCYLMAPPLRLLTQEGRRRLEAIESFSDLGSGIHIAMQDLDIRGAGNLLGAEQSGFIADLGYETYQKILSEAVGELKHNEFADLYKESNPTAPDGVYVSECLVESDLDVLLPASYVPGSGERMSLYRELDGLTNEDEILSFRSRLQDRFGPIPPQTEELLDIVPLRITAAKLGIGKLFLKSGRMTLFFLTDPQSPYYQSKAFGNIIDFMMRFPQRCELREQQNKRSLLIKNVGTVREALDVLRSIGNDTASHPVT